MCSTSASRDFWKAASTTIVSALRKDFTKRYQATKLIHYEDYSEPNSAIDREKQLKGGRRAKKIALIGRLNPRWVDLFEAMIEGMDMTLFESAKSGEPIVRSPSTATGQAGLAQDDTFRGSLSRRKRS